METWEVVCVDKNASMRIREDNKVYNGVRWLLRDINSDLERYLGYCWKDQFVSNERLAKLNVAPKPGDIITLYFDRAGAICKVEVK